MMNILVTGGGGYVGSALVPRLLEKGYNTRVLDPMTHAPESLAPCLENGGFDLIRGDLQDPGCLRHAVREIDCVIHLAGAGQDMGFWAQVAAESGIKRLIRCIPGIPGGFSERSGRGDRPFDLARVLHLKTEPAPERSPAEAYPKELVRTALCPALVYGPSPCPRFDLPVNAFIRDACLKGEILLRGGAQRISLVNLKDLVRILLLLVRAESDQVDGTTFDAGFEKTSLLEIAHRIKDRLAPKKRVDIRMEETPADGDLLLGSERLGRVFGFKPRFTLEDAVDEMSAGLTAADVKSHFIY